MNMVQPIRFLTISLALISGVQADVSSDLDRLEKEIEQIRQQTSSKQTAPTNTSAKALNLYGTFRPVLTVEDDGTDSAIDVRDGLSRFGLTGSTHIMESSKAFFRGEWSIRIADGGQVDGTSSGARKAFVGIEGALGRVAIGKQRPPHYNLIAEHVDIFNHAASPYAYDNVGPFFVDNMTTYQYKVDGLNFQAAFRSDGASGKDNEDMINAGVGFNMSNMYVAAAYLKSTSPSTGVGGPNEEGAETENLAVATYINLDKIYLAAAYQAVTQTPEVGSDIDVTTLDVSASYALPRGYKMKAGVFVYNDGIDGVASKKNQGVNLTLERQLADNVRVHAEYLTKDFDQGDAVSALSVGFRYDFDTDL
jgi:predicted porin